MKLQVILLGEYHSSPLCIYQQQQYDNRHQHHELFYFSIEELDALLTIDADQHQYDNNDNGSKQKHQDDMDIDTHCHGDTATNNHGNSNNVWAQLEKLPVQPSHFLVSACGRRTFIMSDIVIQIARYRNLLALAELCQLGWAEIMAGVVAAPLLTSLGVVAAVPARLIHHPVSVHHVTDFHTWFTAKKQQEQQKQPCYLFHNNINNATATNTMHSTSNITTSTASNSNNNINNNSNNRDLHREEQRLSSFMQKLSHHPLWQGVVAHNNSSNSDNNSRDTGNNNVNGNSGVINNGNGKQGSINNDMWIRFASWFGDYHKQLPPSLLATFKTRRQQQAIIASRQRRLAMESSSTNNHNTNISSTSSTKVIKKRRSNNNTALVRQQDIVMESSSVTSTTSNTSSSTCASTMTNSSGSNGSNSMTTSTCSSRGNSPPSHPPIRLGSPLRHEIRSIKRWTSPPSSSPQYPQQYLPPRTIRNCRSVTELHRPVPFKAHQSNLKLPPPWPVQTATTSPSEKSNNSFVEIHHHHHHHHQQQQQQHSQSTHSRPSSHYHHHQQPRKWSSLQELRHRGSLDSTSSSGSSISGGEVPSNLDLLATQATQRQPILSSSSSTHTSPSPPPRHQSIKLPSPSEMLSRRHPPPSGIV
ncbi:hypothetical protein INT45_007256 [Circinella minor]|uniref:Uncharacterized protein n=1 Tax=Circinella minor TaxID=1195481 RepID=A0A8H7S8Z9_9FUNG|nr:hypothetical protein INT45_007256 [Circinella minor]